MLPASNRGVGGTFNFPDVCLTPMAPAPIPIPYPNFSFTAMAVPFCIRVYVSMVNALNMGSIVVMSTGDEGGVAHPLFKQFAFFTLGNLKIFYELLPAINLGCMNASNGGNAPLGAVLIPSVTNVFLLDAGAEQVTGLRCVDADDAAWRAAEVTPAHQTALVRDGSTPAPQRVGDAVVCRLDRIRIDGASRVAAAIEMARDGGGGVVLDLRGNAGGELDDARRIAEELLPRGAVFAHLEDADGDRHDCLSRHEGDTSVPVWILVDSATASAAELLAGALQRHGRATVVGAEESYGKWRGQVLRHLPGATVYVDAFRCLGPDGEALTEGIVPDVHVALDEDGDVALGEALRLAS